MAAQRKHTRDYVVWNILAWIAFAVFAFFFLYPLIRLLLTGFFKDGQLDLSSYKRFFASKYYMQAIRNSLKVSAIVTVLTIITGLTFAMIVRHFNIKGKKILDILLLVSTITPPFLGSYSWIVLFGRVGTVTKFLNKLFNTTLPGIYGFWGIVFTHVVSQTPIMYMYTSGALKNVDNTLNEVAENLGCTGLRKVFKIIIPLILPSVLSSALLTFMGTFADFGVAKLIGEGYNVMGTLIYNAFMGEVAKDSSMASAMASITLIFTAAIFSLQRWLATRRTVEMNALHPIEQKDPKGLVAFFSHAYVYLMTLLPVLPIGVVTFNSFQKSNGLFFQKGFSLDSYRRVFQKMGDSLQRTYIYGFFAIAAILFIGVIISYANVRHGNRFTKIMDTLTFFPFIVPGTVLGIAMVVAFNGEPFYLNGTPFMIIAAWTIRRLPYTIRSTTSVLHNISASIEEASQSLGANGLHTFAKVTLPVMFSGILPGALLSWIACITELSATVMIYSFRNKTMAIAVYSEIALGNYGTASAMSTILMASAILVLALLSKISKGSFEFSL